MVFYRIPIARLFFRRNTFNEHAHEKDKNRRYNRSGIGLA